MTTMNLVISALRNLTDIRLHEATMKATIAEAEAMRLKIEYHKLCNSG